MTYATLMYINGLLEESAGFNERMHSHACDYVRKWRDRIDEEKSKSPDGKASAKSLKELEDAAAERDRLYKRYAESRDALQDFREHDFR